MAKNITLMGASYSDVPAVDLPQTGGGTARFVDTSDANANQSSLLDGATAYVNGTKITGVIPLMTLPSTTSDTETGTPKADIFPSTLMTTYLNIPAGYNATAQNYRIRALMLDGKTITSNGTYYAGDDDLDGFSSVTVNVSGGASNFVTGTFTTPSTTSTNGTVTVPYTGTGYPIALIIFVEGGCYNSAISGWYNSMTRYAVGQYCITKANTTLAPTYGTSGAANQGSVQLLFKNSTTSATSYSSTRSIAANSYSSTNANGTSTTSVRWRNSTTISYRTAGGTSSTYGLLEDTTYRYIAVYSQ